MELSPCVHNPTFPTFPQVSRTDQYYASLSLAVVGGLVAVSPLHHGGTTHYAAMAHRMLIIVVMGLFLWHAMTARVLEIRRAPYTWPVMAFLVWALLSLGWSPYRHQSLQWVMVFISYGILLGVTPTIFSRQHTVNRLLVVIVVAGVGQALWGAIQLLDGVSRPKGSFFNPNFFAGYLAAISVYPLALLCGREKSPRSAGGSYESGLLWTISAALAFAVMGFMVILAGSRGAALAWAAGVAVVLFARFGMWAIVGLVGLGLMVSLVPNPLQHRVLLEHEVNPLSYARLDIWQSTLRMTVDHPAGIGLGLYQYVFPQYAFPLEHQFVRYGTMAQYAHSDLLQIAAELGLIGAALFAWGVWTVAREIRRHRENPARTSPTWILIGVAGCITVILVQAAVDSNLHEPPIAILLTICVGIVGAICSGGGSHPPLVRCGIERPARWAVASAFVMILLILTVVRTGVAWGFYERGTQCLQARDLQMALREFDMAAWLDSGKALYQSALAATHYQFFGQDHDVRNAAKTLATLSEARRLNPLDGRLAALQGQVFVTLARTLDRTMPDAEVQRRTLLEQAREAYGVAVEREPFSAVYAFELARVDQALGHERRAQEIIKRTLAVEPNFLPAREWLVRLHVRHGELEPAKQEYEQIVARHRAVTGGQLDDLEGRYVQVDVPALAALLARKQES